MCVAEIGWPDSHGMMAGLRIYVQPCLDPVALTGLRGCLGRAPKPTMEGGGGVMITYGDVGLKVGVWGWPDDEDLGF